MTHKEFHRKYPELLDNNNTISLHSLGIAIQLYKENAQLFPKYKHIVDDFNTLFGKITTPKEYLQIKDVIDYMKELK